MIMCGEVCWVVLLTRWASSRPYTACGQIPGVPWNWHFVWIAGRPEGGLGCEVFCLSFHLLFKLRVSGHTYRLASPYFDFRKEVSAEYFPLFPPNLCLSTWLLTLFPRVLPAPGPCSLIPGQFRRLFFLSLFPPPASRPPDWSGQFPCTGARNCLFVLFKSHPLTGICLCCSVLFRFDLFLSSWEVLSGHFIGQWHSIRSESATRICKLSIFALSHCPSSFFSIVFKFSI